MCTFVMVGFSIKGFSSHLPRLQGERTPVNARLKNYIPEYWNFCHSASTIMNARHGKDLSTYSRVVERYDTVRRQGDWCVQHQSLDTLLDPDDTAALKHVGRVD